MCVCQLFFLTIVVYVLEFMCVCQLFFYSLWFMFYNLCVFVGYFSIHCGLCSIIYVCLLVIFLTIVVYVLEFLHHSL